MGLLRLIAIFAAGLLCACDVDPKAELAEGQHALASGAPDRAAASFDRALTRLAPEDPAYVDAMLGRLAAGCFGDPRTTAEEFLALARRFPERVRAPEFIEMSTWFVSSHHWNEAVELVDSGREIFDASNGPLERHAALVREEKRKNKPAVGHLASIHCDFSYSYSNPR